MSAQTLYLIQSSYHETDQILNQLNKIYAENDHIVLMGDAVLFINDQRLAHKQHIFILENDVEILLESIPKQVQIISYAQFADIVLNFKRIIRLK